MKFNEHSNSQAIPKHSFRMLVVGKSQSGKTFLVTKMLTNDRYYRRFFDEIIIVTPNKDQAHYRRIKREHEGVLDEDEEEIYSVELIGWNTKGKDRLHKLLKGKKKERDDFKKTDEDDDDDLTDMKNCLVLFDDVGKTTVASSPEFNALMDRGRHLNISTIFIAHQYFDLPRQNRSSFTDFIMFDMGSKAIKEFYESQATTLMEPRDFAAFAEFVYKKPYKFIYTRTKSHTSEGRFRDGFKNPLYITGKREFKTDDGKFTNNYEGFK